MGIEPLVRDRGCWIFLLSNTGISSLFKRKRGWVEVKHTIAWIETSELEVGGRVYQYLHPASYTNYQCVRTLTQDCPWHSYRAPCRCAVKTAETVRKAFRRTLCTLLWHGHFSHFDGVTDWLCNSQNFALLMATEFAVPSFRQFIATSTSGARLAEPLVYSVPEVNLIFVFSLICPTGLLHPWLNKQSLLYIEVLLTADIH